MSEWENAPSSSGWENAPTPKVVSQPSISPSMLSQATKPLRNLPSDIGKEFSSGARLVKSGTQKIGTGLVSSAIGAGEAALGGMQELFSPITGTAKAIVGDPIRAQFKSGSQIGEFAGNLGEDIASMTGPAPFVKATGAAIKSVGNVTSSIGKAAHIIPKALPKYTQAVHQLMNEGIELTPGQIFHGAAKQAETAVQGAPFLGMMIQNAQRRSIETFNRAATNRALAKIGDSLPKDIEIGRDSIDYAASAIGKKYDDILPKLTFHYDPQLVNDIQAIRLQYANRLTSDYSLQFENNLKNVFDHLNHNGQMTGETFKKLDTDLGYIARTTAKSPDPAQRELSHAISDFQNALRDGLERSNPKYAGELKDINSAWAIFSRVQSASIAKADSAGVFTPRDLLNVIRKSSSKGSFARGDALLQDLGDAGAMVLPATLPAGAVRQFPWYELLLGGEVYGGHPGLAAATLGGSTIPYTKAGTRFINRMASPSGMPATNQAAKSVLPSLGPPAAVAAGTEQNQ